MSRKQWTYAKIMIELYLFGERQEQHLMRELSVSNVFLLRDYFTKGTCISNAPITETQSCFSNVRKFDKKNIENINQ